MIMEVESMIMASNNKDRNDNNDDHILPPGFRFHPTDEELVGFYLRRKVDNRPARIELIGQADIYKYDPWDLPKSGSTSENEWYFFCKRGRKYKNSLRPNRVTGGSGFWKATGIDKPIYSSDGSDHCIGLKKNLVYYRGSAGKGTKTEWMMHEFRLAPRGHSWATAKHINPKNIDEEAEVWTLCRIVKRINACKRKFGTDWRGSLVAAKSVGMNIHPAVDSDTCSVESCGRNGLSNYISFNTPLVNGAKPYPGYVGLGIPNQEVMFPSVIYQAPSAASSVSSYTCTVDKSNEAALLLDREDWEDLRSIVNCAAANPVYL